MRGETQAACGRLEQLHGVGTQRRTPAGARLALAAAAVALMGVSQQAGAASGTWLNTGSTDANWSTTSNWVSGTVPGATSGTANGDTATFNSAVGTYGTSGNPILIDSGRNLLNLTFDLAAAGPFYIGTTGGNTLSLSKNSAITMNAAVTNSQTINAPLQLETNGSVAKFTNNATLSSATLNIGGSITPTTGIGGTTEIQLLGTNTGTNTVSGVISNGGATTKLTKNNAGTWVLTGANTFSGGISIAGGTLSFAGANGAVTGGGAISVSAGATLAIDDSTANANRLSNSAGITLNHGSVFSYAGSSSTSAETTGAFTLGGGISRITIGASGANTAKVTTAAATGGFNRTASSGGFALINGTDLGLANSGQFVTGTAPTQVGTTAGTSSINTGVLNTQIARFVLGESGTSTGQNGTATGTANTFLTYNATTGFRPLNPTDEFTNNAIATGTNTYLTTGTTSTAGGTINSLVVNGGNLDISSGTLTNTSGMLLFAQNNTISGPGTFALGQAEGIVALNSGVTGTISTALGTGATGLTVNGPGTLVLSGANSYAGRTQVGGGATLVVGSDTALGTSSVVAAGSLIRGDDSAHTLGNTLILTTSGMTIGGSSDLTFTGNGSSPAFANTTFANTVAVINNTGTTTFSGTFSLNNAASGSNNGSSILAFGSSANVVISGAIQDNNVGNVATPGTGFGNLTFRGVGANFTISGNNAYAVGKQTQITPSTGYNTVTVGGPGGSGATITPFGATTLHTNTGTTLYLVAETDGQILGNGFTSGGSGMGFGFAGENSLTLGGTWVAGTGSTMTNLATGTLTFGNTISGNALTLQGSGATTLNSNATLAAGAFNLVATQSGTVTLANANNRTGTTTFSGGTVVLDYSTQNNTKLTQNAAAGSAAALSLGSVDLQLSGGSFIQTLGTPSSGTNGTTLTAGQSKITQTSGTSTIALGAITRAANSGGTINFGTGVATTTTANNSAGILGGYAIANGSDWAVANGGGTAISALGTYTTLPATGAVSTGNYLFTGGAPLTTSGSSPTLGSLKIDATADLTIGTTSMTVGGLLFTGSSPVSINGGGLAGSGELIIHNYGTGTLTLASAIGTGSNATSFSGTGTTVLGNAANPYTGLTFLNGGTVAISAIGSLGNTTSGAITFNGGTLETTAGMTTARPVTLGTNGATFQVDAGTFTSTGVISGTSYKGLTKTGAGTLELQGTNTFVGPVTVTNGTLKLSNAAALGTSSTTSNRSVAPVRVNGGTLDINGQATALGNVTLESGVIADTAGTGSLAAYSFTLQSGTVDAVLADVIIAGNSSNSINVTKTTSGTVTLTKANTYTGNTNVNAGTLLVNNTTGSGTGTGAVNVRAGGTLGGTGIIATAPFAGVTVFNGGKLAPGASAGVLTMNLGSSSLDIAGAVGGSNINELIFELGSTSSSDKVSLTSGSLEIGTGELSFSDFAFSTVAGFPSSGTHVYTLFDTNSSINGTLAGSGLSGIITGGVTGSLSLSGDGQDVLLTVAVPEPGMLGLLGVGAMRLLTGRRRRKCA